MQNKVIQRIAQIIISTIPIILGFLIIIGVSSNGQKGIVINPDIYLFGDYPYFTGWALIIIGTIIFLGLVYKNLKNTL